MGDGCWVFGSATRLCHLLMLGGPGQEAGSGKVNQDPSFGHGAFDAD